MSLPFRIVERLSQHQGDKSLGLHCTQGVNQGTEAVYPYFGIGPHRFISCGQIIRTHLVSRGYDQPLSLLARILHPTIAPALLPQGLPRDQQQRRRYLQAAGLVQPQEIAGPQTALCRPRRDSHG